MEIKKYYIRGNKERGSEVIKALEDLGGINKVGFSGKDEDQIFWISGDMTIDCINRSCSIATAIMWSGEELKLPEQKPEPKFKVGDKVITIFMTVLFILWQK